MHNVKAKVFALLMAVCMVASYMPTYTFAAEADNPVLTQFTVEGASDGDVLKAMNESGETDLTVDKTGEKTNPAVNEIEGESLTLSYEVAEGSTLQLRGDGVEESLEGSGSVEIAGGGSVEAKFEKPEAAEPQAEESAEVQETPAKEDSVKKEPAKEEPAKAKEEPAKKEVKEQAKEEAKAIPYDPDHPTEEMKKAMREERIKAYGTEGLLGELESPFPPQRLLFKAIPSGTKINYNSTEREYDVPYNDNTRGVRKFSATIDGVYYEGTCAQAGVDAASSGTATLRKADNTSRAAKMIYHLVYEEGWWNKSDGTDTSPIVPGIGEWFFPHAHAIEAIAQAYFMGSADAFVSGYESNGFDGDIMTAIYNWIFSYNISGITVPDGFELYYCDAGSYQNFVLWKYNPSGHITVQKKSSESGLVSAYSLAGAQYYVYTDSACKTRAKDTSGNAIVLTTNAQGKTNTATIASGTYYVKEAKAPTNFNLDATVHKVTVSGNTQTVTSTEVPKKAYAYLQKSAAKTENDFVKIAPNNYSLEGAQYNLYKSSDDSAATDIKGNKIVFKSTQSGKSQTVNILPGTYYAEEVKTKVPKGFKLDDKVADKNVRVTLDNDSKNPAKFTSVEEPVYAPFNFKAKKIDADGVSGWKKLLKAQYTMCYYNLDPNSTPEEIAKAKPVRTWIFETVPKVDDYGENYAGIDAATDDPIEGSDEFFMEDGERILPLGVITIQETMAPKGLAKSEEIIYGKVYQPTTGSDAKFEVNGSDDLSIAYRLKDESQYPTIKLRKSAPDEVSDKSLAGAVYEVYYEDPLADKNVKVGELVTDEKGIGRDKDGKDGISHWQVDGQDPNKLPMGRYYIKEVHAPDGFTVDALYYVNNPDDSVNEDGEHIIVARSKEINADTIEYTVDSYELPHHTVIHKTDLVTGEELEGAKLQVLNSKGEVIEEWTSGKEPHDIVALNDETQGLKDGKYTLREITAPYGYDVAEDVEFEVSSGAVKNTVEMKNAPIERRTTATSEATGTHVGTFSSEEKIKDVVKFKNLFAGREYTFKGVLMDKETGKELLDKDGNKVTAEKKYTPQGEKGTLVSGEVELEFTFDASAFEKEKTVVAFETVEREKKELATHSDLEDEDQTVHYGGIVGTTAVDKESKSHNVLAGENAVIVDTVEYKNLAPGETYVLTGELYDKTTGELTGVTSSKTFVPETADGTVDVEFNIDASELEAHTLVAYEHLAIKATIDGTEKEVPIDDHENPDDEDQTVHIPKFRTTATETTTEEHIAMAKKDVVVYDTVKYENLIPGKEYTAKGKMVYKDSGNDVLVDGKTVTAEAVFTPEDYNGEVVLEFKFDAVTLAGKSIVAFEEVYEEFLVGVHADLEDEEQTVHVPKIGTTAIDTGTGDHVAALSERNTVVDTVEYHNLIPGKEYVMKGILMSKENGEPIMENGEQVTSELEFTPEKADGTVDLEFTVSPDNLRGGALVAFEDLFFIKGAVDDNPDDEDVPEEEEVLIAEHKDIDDEDQTVYVPEIGTSLKDAATDDHIANGTKDIKLVDEVSYRGLTPGKTYVMEGTLMNKKTGNPVLVGGNPLVIDKEFTPEESEGSVELEFTFDGSILRGETVVAFETCFFENIPVAIHADIEDEEQTVHIPKVGTKVGKKEGKYVIDTVEYSNLIPGKKYIVKGIFVGKANGRKVKGSDGTTTFVPETPNGKIEVKLDPGQVSDPMVAFEELYMEAETENGPSEVLVGEHKDINDADQTFKPAPKTGEDPTVLFIGGAFLLTAALYLVMRRRAAQKNN